MKFTVNRKAFIEAIKPAMGVAGKEFGKYNIEKYSRMTHQTLNEYLGSVKEAITSSISEVSQNEKYTILTKARNTIQKKVLAHIIGDFEKLRRITFEAYKDRIIVSSSNGDIVLSIEMSGEDLTSIGYKCEKGGSLTVESARLWVLLESLKKCDKLIFSFDGECLVKIESEQKKDAIRQIEKLFYHVKPSFERGPTFVTATSSRILADGLRSVMFAVDTKGQHKAVIVCISKDRLRFIGSNGQQFAVYDIQFEQEISKKSICFAISKDIAESLIRTLSKMKDKDIEIWRGPKARSGEKPWNILFKQGNTILSFVVENGDRLKSTIEDISDYDYKYRASTKAEEWILIFNNTKPSRIAKSPLISIKADFIEGCFELEHHSGGCRITSCIPFSYEAGISYIDTKSIKSEEISLKPYFVHLAKILKKAKPDDILKFEFGSKHTSSRKGKYKHINHWGIIRYPVKTNKSKGISKKLVALFQINPGKDNSHD